MRHIQPAFFSSFGTVFLLLAIWPSAVAGPQAVVDVAKANEATANGVRVVLLRVARETQFGETADGKAKLVPCFRVTYLMELVGEGDLSKIKIHSVQVSSTDTKKALIPDGQNGGRITVYPYESFDQANLFHLPRVASPKRAQVIDECFRTAINAGKIDLTLTGLGTAGKSGTVVFQGLSVK